MRPRYSANLRVQCELFSLAKKDMPGRKCAKNKKRSILVKALLPLLLSLLLLLLANGSAQGTLLASWRQDEPDGNLHDETGQNPEAAPFGTPTYGNPGVPNGIYGSIVVSNAFGSSVGYGPSATDASFIVGSDNNNPVMNIEPTGQLTVMGWIQPGIPTQATSFTYRLISTGSSAGGDFGWAFGLRFTIAGDTTIPFVRFTNYGVIDKDSPAINVVFGEWMHIAATYDSGQTSLYLNGEFLSTHADTRVFGNDSPNNRQVIGGRLGGSNNEQASGLLDGIRVYDSVLTIDEIRFAAAEAVSAIPEPTTVLLAFLGMPALLRKKRMR
jgi:hypothetical protein